MDLIYLAIAALFFAATWGLLRLCETLAARTRRGRS